MQYQVLVKNIGGMVEAGRETAYRSINNVLLKTYWEIGRLIVEFEQQGKEKAEYGRELLKKLSRDLKLKHGKGFSISNLQYFRLFYLHYPIYQTLSGKLSWSHYTELLAVSSDLARGFYEKQSINESWSVRELHRQINSMLFERIALSKDKKGVLKLSKKGHVIEKDKDILKEPFILEFLGIPENHRYSERELEQKIIDNLQLFLLELGKGFTFVGRQFRISFENKHFEFKLMST
ncbi:MAG: PDDEXK nuclease domain-containing protein [Bacteroidota bacterium]